MNMTAKTALLFFISLGLLACNGKSSEAGNPPPPSATAQVQASEQEDLPTAPLRTFFTQLGKSASSQNQSLGSELHFPAVWLFAPDGKRVAVLDENNPSVPGTWPEAGDTALSLEVFRNTWNEVADAPMPDMPAGQGLAVFISDKSIPEECDADEKCKAIQALLAEAGNALNAQTVSLALDFQG